MRGKGKRTAVIKATGQYSEGDIYHLLAMALSRCVGRAVPSNLMGGCAECGTMRSDNGAHKRNCRWMKARRALAEYEFLEAERAKRRLERIRRETAKGTPAPDPAVRTS